MDQSLDSNLIEIKIGNRITVMAAKLNGLQARKAEFMSRPNDDMDKARCRALFAVRKINDEPFDVPKNDGDLNRVASKFSATELDAFMLLYNKETTDPAIEEQIKKLLEPQEPS